jgi:ribosomal protein S2
MKRIEEQEESSAQRERERERERERTEVHKLRHYDNGINTLGNLPEMVMAAGSRT